MSSFQQALAHFRKAASQRMNQPEQKLRIIPDAENLVGLPELALPPFIAFQAEVERKVVRGLAAPAGTVVMVSQGKIENLGAMLEAMHVLEPERSLPAVDIARRIVWLYGMDFSLIAAGHSSWTATVEPPANLEDPTLTRAADGSAELRFFVNEAGDTGSIRAHEVVIRVAPGYQATVNMSRAGS